MGIVKIKESTKNACYNVMRQKLLKQEVWRLFNNYHRTTRMILR